MPKNAAFYKTVRVDRHHRPATTTLQATIGRFKALSYLQKPTYGTGHRSRSSPGCGTASSLILPFLSPL